MSTFLNRAYGAANYAKFRPTYPDSLFNRVLAYYKQHSGRERANSGDLPVGFAIDLACGPGQATKELGRFSAKVLGIDHSAGMVEEANKKGFGPQFRFAVGTDKSLTDLAAADSVDLLTVAQGAHWFTYPDFWHSAAHILKPGGTLAIWGYWTFAFPDYPAVASIIDDFAYAPDECGPYWDKGRHILDAGYEELNESIPSETFTDVEYCVNRFDNAAPDMAYNLVRHDVPLAAVDSMLRTWSSYFNYKQANPDKEDPVDRAMARIEKETGLGASDTVTVKWNTVYLLATRRTR